MSGTAKPSDLCTPPVDGERTSPVRRPQSGGVVSEAPSKHGRAGTSCKLSLQSGKPHDERLTDVVSLNRAATFARFIENAEAVHHRDLDSARLRLEALYGIAPGILWKWRHRPPQSVRRSELTQLAGVALRLAPQLAADAIALGMEAGEVATALQEHASVDQPAGEAGE